MRGIMGLAYTLFLGGLQLQFFVLGLGACWVGLGRDPTRTGCGRCVAVERAELRYCRRIAIQNIKHDTINDCNYSSNG